MSKKYDIVAAVSHYKQNGEDKTRWQNVGAVMQGDKGPYLLLAKWFNPAGLAEEGRESVILSLFDANREKGKSNGGSRRSAAPEPSQGGFEDDIPFN